MRKSVTLELEDRGKTLRFDIKEMSATHLESWIIRALLIIAGNTNATISDLNSAAESLMSQGLAALSRVKYEDAEPLLEEMLQCCTRVDAGVRQVCTAESVDGYIEDVQTLFRLRMEAFKLNLSFFGEANRPTPEKEPTVTLKAPKKG